MKKNLFYSIMIVAITIFSTLNILKSQSTEKIVDLRMANIAALSDENNNDENSSGWGCGGNPTFIPYETLRDESCVRLDNYEIGSKLLCKGTEKKVCCNPANQTKCR